MKNQSRTRKSILALVVAALPASFATAEVVSLGTLGGPSSRANAINSAGQVVGVSLTAGGESHAFLSSGGVMTDLGTLGGDYSEAVAINDAGQVAGHSKTAAGVIHPFLYEAGVMTDLDPTATAWEYVAAINASGQVAGWSTAYGQGFLYSGGAMTRFDLAVTQYEGARVVAMNDAGDVVGMQASPQHDPNAFLYRAGVVTDLGTFGGADSRASDINNLGQVVGSARGHTGDWQAFLYEGDDLADLGASHANAINEAGQVAGSVARRDKRSWIGGVSPVLYGDGRVKVLGTFGGIQATAVGINASGQVAGHSDTIDGESPFGATHAFVYSRGHLGDLGWPGVAPMEAVAINDAGQVAGNFDMGSLPGIGPVSMAFLRSPSCGDGVLDLGEECDDHNVVDGDCCASDCTYPGPAPTCLAAAGSKLVLKDTTSGIGDRIVWRWRGGDVSQADLGDPGATTTYTLCISDATLGVDRLVASLEVEPNGNWTNNDPDGWEYEDAFGVESGVLRAVLKPGAGSAADLRVVGRGRNLPMPEPFAANKFFDSDGRVTVQLFRSGSPLCWSAEYLGFGVNDGFRFTSKLP